MAFVAHDSHAHRPIQLRGERGDIVLGRGKDDLLVPLAADYGDFVADVEVSSHEGIEIVGDDLAGNRGADDQPIDLGLDFRLLLAQRSVLGGLGLLLGRLVVLAVDSLLKTATA